MISSLKKIIHNCKNQKKYLTFALICSFLKSFLGLTQILSVIYAIDVLLLKREVNDTLIIVGILTIVCVLGSYIISYFEQNLILSTSFFMSRDKRLECGNKLRKMPLGFFTTSSRTKVITMLTTTVSGMETASAMVFVGIVTGLLNAFALFVFMMIYDWHIGLIAGAGMIVYLLVVVVQMKQSRKISTNLTEATNELSNSTINFLKGIKVTKSYSYENGDTRVKKAIENSAKENINLTTKSMPTQYLGHITIAVFESLILIMALVLFLSLKINDVSKTLVLIIFSFMIYASLNQAGSMLSMIGLLDNALNEIEDFENEKELETLSPIEVPNNKDIVFKNVSFKYEDSYVLKNVSCEIKENTFTAIVGPSGSGKTTLCHLIPRFYEINEGEITLGGVNIKHIDYNELSKMISMVFQRVYLFEDTILNNVKFARPDATLDEVIAACKKAQCHDFIMNLKDGYDTMLSEAGSSLSGGEKQRISIARAILKDSPIIILDEATASVDYENEYEITKAINELTKNKTVISIAHKLETIKNADKIIVLDKGEIVQSGTHEQLKSEPGLYKKFIDLRQKANNFTITK